jgi:glycosyltransferase involved in cell wall biosynthesis
MTRRPRILLSVHSAGRGGAELMALAQARYLSQWYDLIISVPEGPLRADFERLGALTGGTATLPLWGAPARRWALRLIRMVRDVPRVLRTIRSTDPQVVLTNSSVSLAPVLAARLADVPVIVHARDVPKSRLSGFVFALHGALANTVIVIAEQLARYFQSSLRARVVRIDEGIAIGEPPSSRTARMPEDPLRLCLIGGIDPRKGQDTAIEAIALLRDRGVDAELELVGREVDSGFAARLREQVTQLAVSKAVRFSGEVSDVRTAMGRADVVIAPSRSEWTPLSLMEAMACEKPVVASRVGGVGEMIADWEVGLLVPPENPDALARRLIELAAKPDDAQAMGRNGRRHVTAHFNITRSLERQRAEIERLVTVQRRRSRLSARRGRRRP